MNAAPAAVDRKASARLKRAFVAITAAWLISIILALAGANNARDALLVAALISVGRALIGEVRSGALKRSRGWKARSLTAVLYLLITLPLASLIGTPVRSGGHDSGVEAARAFEAAVRSGDIDATADTGEALGLFLEGPEKLRLSSGPSIATCSGLDAFAGLGPIVGVGVTLYDECYRFDVVGEGEIVLGTEERWGRWWATGYAWNPTADGLP